MNATTNAIVFGEVIVANCLFLLSSTIVGRAPIYGALSKNTIAYFTQ